MEDLFFLIDLGSTYTKVIAVDLTSEMIVGRSQSPTTAETNVLTGLLDAFDKLAIYGKKADERIIAESRKLASSSAAGGLCIVAIGLVPDLTLEAAKKAALGAGAKVTDTYSYEIDENDVKQIERNGCDIILLVGGIDGGNKDVILHNAAMLSNSTLDVPIIAAGNAVVGSRVREMLEAGGKHVENTENVLPELDKLNVEPVRTCIRNIFMKSIVHAKGLDKAESFIGEILMPTPMATLKAAALLADGHGSETGFGELMVVEVGGATTNIHSIATGYSNQSRSIYKGLPEPYEKRTVEGDLGIRYNAETILNLVSAGMIQNNASSIKKLSEKQVEEDVLYLSKHVSFIPANDREVAVDVGLARSAVEIAVERHVGTIKESWGLNGEISIQYGKDLTELGTIIGTGGVFAFNPYPEMILQAALMNKENPFSLRPKNPNFYVDKNYLLYGLGLLSGIEPAKALRIGKKYLSRSENNGYCIN